MVWTVWEWWLPFEIKMDMMRMRYFICNAIELRLDSKISLPAAETRETEDCNTHTLCDTHAWARMTRINGLLKSRRGESWQSDNHYYWLWWVMRVQGCPITTLDYEVCVTWWPISLSLYQLIESLHKIVCGTHHWCSYDWLNTRPWDPASIHTSSHHSSN